MLLPMGAANDGAHSQRMRKLIFVTVSRRYQHIDCVSLSCCSLSIIYESDTNVQKESVENPHVIILWPSWPYENVSVFRSFGFSIICLLLILLSSLTPKTRMCDVGSYRMNNAEHVYRLRYSRICFPLWFIFFERQISSYAPRPLPVFIYWKGNQLGAKMMCEEVTREWKVFNWIEL